MALAKVFFRTGKDIPESVRKEKGIGESDFVEVRVENTIPKITFKKIESPARRVKSILATDKVKITL